MDPAPVADQLLIALRPVEMPGGGICPVGGPFFVTEKAAKDLLERGQARRANRKEREKAGAPVAPEAGPSEVQDRPATETKMPRWTLRQTPAEYLKASPDGPMAELARAILAAEAAKKAG